MAKEAEKSGPSSDKDSNEKAGSAGSGTPSKPAATAGSRSSTASGEKSAKAGEESPGAGAKKTQAQAGRSGDQGDAQSRIAEFQSKRHRELEGVLAKRSDESAIGPAIVKEFAAIWLPHHLAEAELLAPAFEDAGVDEDKMAAVRVRKDILNMLLADLLESGTAEHAKPKLEALADALTAVVAAAKEELDSLSEAESADEEELNNLRSQLETRFAEAKAEFEDIDESFQAALKLLAPRMLSIASMRLQGRRTGSAPRYSEAERQRASGERGGGYRGVRNRYEEEDEDYRPSRRARYYDEDEEYGGRSGASRRRDEDEERYGRSRSGGRGQEREGYSQAPRRGWQESGYRSQRGDDEEGYARGRSRYAEDEPRGYGGRRSGYESRAYERQRGSAGEAYESQRGGTSRGNHYGEDYRRRGGRYQDEDERSSHGGWSGDPEGHSEAARKGWEHRRGR
jgi:hypothetical protein